MLGAHKIRPNLYYTFFEIKIQDTNIVTADKSTNLIKINLTAWNEWISERSADVVDARDLDLRDADLTGINLGHANWQGTTFDAANLSNCVGKAPNLSNISAIGVRFSRAHLSGRYHKQVDPGNWLVYTADFEDSDLSKAQFDRAILKHSDFRRAIANNTNFYGSDLFQSLFGNAILRGANFKHAYLKGASFNGADISNAKFNGSDLRYADFKGAIIDSTDFENAELSGAKFDDNAPENLRTRAAKLQYASQRSNKRSFDYSSAQLRTILSKINVVMKKLKSVDRSFKNRDEADSEIDRLELFMFRTLDAISPYGIEQEFDINGPLIHGVNKWDYGRASFVSGGIGSAIHNFEELRKKVKTDLKRRLEYEEDELIVGERVFIVHGHDEGARESVARFVERLGLVPVILHEQANKGRTIITKFQEEAAGVGFAVVLITPDDIGGKTDSTPRPRARQNVVFELGFFIGALGADKVAALVKGDVEKPSDFDGVVYISLDEGNWNQQLGRELEAAGFDIDWNKLMRPQ